MQRDSQNQTNRIEKVEPNDNLNDPPECAACDALGKEEPNVEQQDGELGEEHARAGDHLEVLKELDILLVFCDGRVCVVHCRVCRQPPDKRRIDGDCVLPPPCCIIITNSVHSTMVPIQATSMDPKTHQRFVSSSLLREGSSLELVGPTIIPPELLVNGKSGVEPGSGEYCRQREE